MPTWMIINFVIGVISFFFLLNLCKKKRGEVLLGELVLIVLVSLIPVANIFVLLSGLESVFTAFVNLKFWDKKIF